MRRPLILFLSLALAQAACRDRCSRAEPAEPADDEDAAIKPVHYPMEVYGDPRIFSTPRLQFAWRPTGEKDWTLWSIRLDGTDLRRVAKPELLDRFNVNFGHTPVRSPDNRYVVAEADDLKRVLIDLKTQTARVIGQGGTVPYFQWTEDSRAVIFYLNYELRRYDLAKGKLEYIPMIYSRGLYVLRGSGNFLAVKDWGFVIHGPDGKELRSVTLGENLADFHAATPDGRLLMYHDGPYMVVIRTDDPEHPIYRGRRTPMDTAFGPEGKVLYFQYDGSIHKLNLSTRKVSLVFRSPGRWSVSDITLFNDRGAR